MSLRLLLISILLICLHTVNGQDTNTFKYSSFVYIPISINNSEVKKLIDAASPTEFLLTENLDTKQYNFKLNISNGETTFSKNTIYHNIVFSNGKGYYKKRTSIKNPWPFEGRTYSPWIRIECKDISGYAKVTVSTLVNEDYSISTNSSYNVSINQCSCAGLNLSSILKTLGLNKMNDNISEEIDDELQALNLKEEISLLWSGIQDPIQIDSSLFLIIKPEKLYYKDFLFDSTHLNLGLGLSFSAKTASKLNSQNLKIKTPLANLSKLDTTPKSSVDLHVPIYLDYETIEKQAEEALVGQIISRKNRKGKEKSYAKIVGINVAPSKKVKYDIVFGVKLKTLNRFFKKKEGFVYIHANIQYDKTKNILYADSFKIDAKTDSWITNNSMELLTNSILHNVIKDELLFDIGKEISAQKDSINKMLSNNIELSKGVFLSGKISEISINKINALPEYIFLDFSLIGKLKMKIENLDF